MTNSDNSVPAGLESLSPIQLLQYLLSAASRDLDTGPVVDELIIAKDPAAPMRRNPPAVSQYRIGADDGQWQDVATGEVTSVSNPTPFSQGVERS